MTMEDLQGLSLCMLAYIGSLKLKSVQINEYLKNEIKKKFIIAIRTRVSDKKPEWSVRKRRSAMKRTLNTAVLSSTSSASESVQESKVMSDEDHVNLKASKKRFNDHKKRSTKKEGPEPSPDMPARMRGKIGIENKSVTLILQKTIKKTDIDKDQNRLLMPINHIMNDSEFLSSGEKNEVSRKEGNRIPGLTVRLLDPRLSESEITFKKWDMNHSSSYVFNDTWSTIVKANGIQLNDVVQLWFYRDAHQNPCFALVNLTRPID